MYDANCLMTHFERTGFAEVQEMRFKEGRILRIQEVEQPSRVLNCEGICVKGSNWTAGLL